MVAERKQAVHATEGYTGCSFSAWNFGRSSRVGVVEKIGQWCCFLVRGSMFLFTDHEH
jgi:hypothetical protein